MGCSIILKMIFNSSAPVLFTLTNCPTHEGKTQVLNRVTSFIVKFKIQEQSLIILTGKRAKLCQLINLTLKSVRTC